MPTTSAGVRLTEAHRLAQARLATEVTARALILWPLLDPARLDATQDAWVQAMLPMIRTASQRSAAIAAAYVKQMRYAEIGSSLAALPPVPFEARATQISLYVTGPVGIKDSLKRGVTLAKALQTAKTSVLGSASRHATNGGRSAVLASVQADHRAVSWFRITSGRCCAFCALMASRGPIYKSESTADFKPHDACHCAAAPSYHQDAPWPAASVGFSKLYAETALNTDDPINAFRRAYERPQVSQPAVAA